MGWLDGTAMAPAESLQAILDAALVERVVYAATTLTIPELLAAGPRDVEGLAAETGTRPRLLARMLRFLVAAGVFTEPQPYHFGLAPVGELLCADAPGSMRPLVLFRGEPWKRVPWDDLVDSLRTGETAFDRTVGASFFEYLADHPGAGAVFDAAMTGRTRQMLGLVPRHYDFSSMSAVVDVGGGEGELLLDILKHAPAAHGVLFDQPHVVERAAQRIKEAGLSDRCTVIGGNFFDTIPPGADVYVMKMILHDWDDDRARVILGACRQAMGPDSRLLLVERVLPAAPPYPLEPFMGDMTMMLELGSWERTDAEWRDLLASAGLHLARIIRTGEPMSLIEGRPQ